MPENSLVISIRQRPDNLGPYTIFNTQEGGVTKAEAATINVVFDAGTFDCEAVGPPSQEAIDYLRRRGHPAMRDLPSRSLLLSFYCRLGHTLRPQWSKSPSMRIPRFHRAALPRLSAPRKPT